MNQCRSLQPAGMLSIAFLPPSWGRIEVGGSTEDRSSPHPSLPPQGGKEILGERHCHMNTRHRGTVLSTQSTVIHSNSQKEKEAKRKRNGGGRCSSSLQVTTPTARRTDSKTTTAHRQPSGSFLDWKMLSRPLTLSAILRPRAASCAPARAKNPCRADSGAPLKSSTARVMRYLIIAL